MLRTAFVGYFYGVIAFVMWNNHMTKAQSCINTQQNAAKTISKDQQPLVNYEANFGAFLWSYYVQQVIYLR